MADRKDEDKIMLAHGSGGRAMQELISSLLLPAFGNPLLDPLDDSAILHVGGSDIAFTTDSYTVDPIFFPGGDIGRLAVCGTVNDLAVCGAQPLGLSCGLILEEGLPLTELETIVASMKTAAEEAGVQIVTGDTKVLPKGKADRIFINTAGLGIIPPERGMLPGKAEPGDVILVNGFIADHGAAVMAAREQFALKADIESDVAPLNSLVDALLAAAPATKCMKDPTRGGVAGALNEIASDSEVSIFLDETTIPVRKPVESLCELLGLDPLYFANEGKLLAVVPADQADAALQAMRSHPYGRDAVAVGEVRRFDRAPLAVRTAFGSHRIVGVLTGEQLPRIC